MKICRDCSFEGDDNLFSQRENRCKECIRLYQKQYRKKNTQILKIKRGTYYLTNQIEILQNNKRNLSILNYLPYTMEDLKRHLEIQFDNKMTWENYGTYWHIDHIIPQCKLIYTSMDDDNFKKCWALNNLRPLDAITNMKKGGR